ncbi:hypothetical protein KQX54_005897 [Cotesia glomerata]|uniref:Secreted protein n=1 Tax=Cotesia glomerata TaxID=32391 RepID=A0AAV7IN01_COTGL|nr:hypothetical protein KQX54_005897 [Cotesia glomerata]
MRVVGTRVGCWMLGAGVWLRNPLHHTMLPRDVCYPGTRPETAQLWMQVRNNARFVCADLLSCAECQKLP